MSALRFAETCDVIPPAKLWPIPPRQLLSWKPLGRRLQHCHQVQPFPRRRPPPTITPAPTLVPTPTAIVAEEPLFDALIKPLVSKAQKRRAERAKTDPDLAVAMDSALNEGRVNFLLFGYGEKHEPPVAERAIIGSDTLISYNLRRRQADIVSFTHDVRALEVERAFWKAGDKPMALRIDQAYNVGGFPLMRKTLRDATGLAIDYQIVFRDSVMVDLIDGVFDGIEIGVPSEFSMRPFYLDGK